jgi:putative ABC transport system permease protein
MRIAQRSEELRDDVAFAVRQLRAAPAFTAVAVVTLALGIGANSAMFALVDATLLRPLPFTGADRLVMVSEINPAGNRGAVNPLDLADWSARNRTFQAMAAVVGSQSAITGADGIAERVPAQAVTARFFDVLGVTALAGRTFLPSDDAPMSTAVVISEGFWRSHFGGDQTIVGRDIRLGGRTMTVIGVVPASFQFDIPGSNSVGPSSVWSLLSLPQDRGPAQRYPHYLQVVGRLKPGVALEAARDDIRSIADGIARESPATNRGHGATVDPLRERLAGRELRLTSILLLGVVGFVLLMCCANVANLLLARTSARAREFAVRSALGAGRRRIVRQLLTESVVLAALGGIVGVAVGAAILNVVPALLPAGLLPLAFPLAFDGRVLIFCVTTASVVAVIYGLAPAWQATGRSLAHVMSIDSRTSTGTPSNFRRALAIGEVAVAVLLLCGAGLLVRTLLTLQRVDPGHRATDLLTMVVNAGMGDTPQNMREFYQAVERDVERVADVGAVALGGSLPLDGVWYEQSFQIEGDPPRPPADRNGAGYQMVSAAYFRVLGIPLVDGRDFTDADTAGRTEVCIVDEEFVRRYLEGREPVGTRIAINAMVTPPQAVLREIVGVVKHVKDRPNEATPLPHVYVPIAQNPWWTASLIVQPRSGSAAALTSAVRTAIARVNRDRPVTNVRTLSGIGVEATSRPRFRAVLVGSFALLALMLAVVGVFGVFAYSVQQRTREFGVRIALGASARSVLGLVLSSAGRVIAAGVALGLGAAALLGRSMSAFLFGVQPLDLTTFIVSPLVLIATAAIAVMVPAWRASRVDPVVAFRNE